MGRTQVGGSCACGQKGGQMSPLDPPKLSQVLLYSCVSVFSVHHLAAHTFFQVKTLIQWLLIEVSLLPEHYSLQLYYPF